MAYTLSVRGNRKNLRVKTRSQYSFLLFQGGRQTGSRGQGGSAVSLFLRARRPVVPVAGLGPDSVSGRRASILSARNIAQAEDIGMLVP